MVYLLCLTWPTRRVSKMCHFGLRKSINMETCILLLFWSEIKLTKSRKDKFQKTKVWNLQRIISLTTLNVQLLMPWILSWFSILLSRKLFAKGLRSREVNKLQDRLSQNQLWKAYKRTRDNRKISKADVVEILKWFELDTDRNHIIIQNSELSRELLNFLLGVRWAVL